jgi:hypothetical protein
MAFWNRGERAWLLFDAGEWDQLLELTEDYQPDSDPAQVVLIAARVRAHVVAHRGHVTEAAALMDHVLPRARSSGDPQVYYPALAVDGLVAELQGRKDDAVARVDELADAVAGRPWLSGEELFEGVRVCQAANAPDLAARLLAVAARPAPRRVLHSVSTGQAVLAEMSGEAADAAGLYAGVAECWREFGVVLEEGRALLGSGRCLLALGRDAEAVRSLEAAGAIFERLGAGRLLAETTNLRERRAAG